MPVFLDNVTYFDVEYANSKNKSLCQIGLFCEEYGTKEIVYAPRSILINPDDNFDPHCVSVHGIAEAKVNGAPTFLDVWPTIEQCFTKSVVIGHNVASSDLDALVKNLNRYGLDIPEIYYVCTLDLAKRYLSSYEVENYKLSTLCEYFEINLDKAHDALNDALACKKLFELLVAKYEIDIDCCVKKYESKRVNEFVQYISSSDLRKSISEFYGVLRGFSIDGEINEYEVDFIRKWRDDNQKYSDQREISDILDVINRILEDGIVLVDEVFSLQCSIRKYLDMVSSSPITLATQILDGILKGITVDGIVSEEEGKNLRIWLYDNIYLADHFPFNKVIAVLDKVLEDSVLTQEESVLLTAAINDMLNPVESMKSQMSSIEGLSICLSGNFVYGSKSDVEKYIQKNGGKVDSSVKKTTDILLIGEYGSADYSNGTYGTKVKKAIEYNEKGCNIKIVKESDFIFEN